MNNENITLSPKMLTEEIVKILDSKKAKDIKALYVEEQTVLADYFVICCGNSNTQIRALAGEVEEKLKEINIEPHHIEGYNEASWTILDYGTVIVHIFSREAREFYKLEKLWSDSENIDISSLLI